MAHVGSLLGVWGDEIQLRWLQRILAPVDEYCPPEIALRSAFP